MTRRPRTVGGIRRRAHGHGSKSQHMSRTAWRTRQPSASIYLLSSLLWLRAVSAVLIPFENCLPDDYRWDSQAHKDDPNSTQIQWIPKWVDAKFNLSDPQHQLIVTIWGNVTGRLGQVDIPAWNSTEWDNPNSTLAHGGQILNQPQGSNFTTLHSKIQVASYTPYSSDLNFCDSINNGSCPLSPVFEELADPLLPYGLPYFNVSHNFESTYAFASFAPTFFIYYDKGNTIGCMSAVVTPSLGGIAWFLRFLPLIVLLLVGFATIFSAIFSPWGTADVFHWTTNYGRDLDLLRLVTPGFGDCLQYIQFIALTGGLSLNYPGFYQPAVSNGAWSALMFNESFVAHADPWENLIDGVYNVNATTGLQSLSQLVGMSQVEDIWAGMMIWLLVIIAASLIAVQLGFFGRWVWRYVRHTSEEDLRAKNMPFSVGIVVRLVFNYFLLPIVALSTYQLVVAEQSQVFLVALAVITIALIIGFASYLMYLIVSTKPRAHLFDDLSTVLLYGPLYNTYSDEAAPFALIPIILTFMRGIAIGAVQDSGVAQIVILAVCEIIQMLTIHAFRPFNSSTNMNAYHTGFSLFRFLTVLPMVAFVSSMGLTGDTKDWVGYVILLLHGGVLVFGFFLNSLMTIIEVIARMLGAGGDDVRGQKRGGLSKIFGARQLQRRVSRRGATSRQSQLSTAGMLDAYNSQKRGYGRVRSESAGSMGILLNQPGHRGSSALDNRRAEASTFSLVASPGHATRPQPAADPYYRPPRARRLTDDDLGSSPPGLGRGSIGSIDLADRRLSQSNGTFMDAADFDRSGKRPVSAAPGVLAPAPASYMPVFAPRADYSTREVDFYYGVRGPALNSDAPNRRLGTGPADPTSPVATATGWLRGLFGGKTKEKGKGFEVVRSARMPPAMKARGGDLEEEAPPEGIPVAMGVIRSGPIESDDEDMPKIKLEKRPTRDSVKQDAAEAGTSSSSSAPSSPEVAKVSANPPLLPDLDAGESFRFPSRIHSTRTTRQSSRRKVKEVELELGDIPDVPRKSSKRNQSQERIVETSLNALQPPLEVTRSLHPDAATTSTRLPFDRTNSQKRLSGSSMGEPSSAGMSADSGDERPTSIGYVHRRNPSQVDPSSTQDLDLLGSTAEVVGNSRQVSPMSSVSGLSTRAV
ncbi:hypothetical protein BKA67DRAFT_661286 [Truncatella angustata]|uniref:ML-like domain-containing protein n=1 Tax=Truncatella angustata TaxID=152316 RepID=A0A9P8UE65_9PEZI|nr:uncharacterized protein BKA67DRAFT_661286 [Truncatella angustata]KAH6648300.1 hypothetical protein BKA67DRAFT_661286 [Truncatella angustata]